METLVYLDTNAVLWLAAAPHKLTKKATTVVRASHQVRISPMVKLELHYLREVGRILRNPDEVLEHLAQTLPLRPCPESLEEVVAIAKGLVWTREPFDRLITAHAAVGNHSLVTGDETIRRHYRKAVW